MSEATTVRNEAATVRFVGLDVHRDTIAIAVAELDGGPAESLAVVPNDVVGLIKRLHRLGPVESLRCCYEAGPTGFGCRSFFSVTNAGSTASRRGVRRIRLGSPRRPSKTPLNRTS